MSKLSGLSGGQTVGIAGAAAAVVVGGVLYLAGVFTPDAPMIEPQPVAQVEPEAQATEPAAEETAASTGTAETQRADPITPKPPTISTFRLDPDGQMLVSGRAEPGWETSILIDDDILATFQSEGEFVQFLELEGSAAPRVLTLAMRSPETGESITSLDEVIIAPSPATAMALKTEEAEGTAPAESTVEPETTVEAEPAEQVPSQTVLLSNESGVSVIQPPTPGEDFPELMSTVALDAITYSSEGEVQLSGRARGKGFVRIYLDDAPITTSRIQQDGAWRSELTEVDTGVYTLRIDELDSEGNVISRVETPFKREERELLIAGGDNLKVRAITVQPGNTLWAISRQRYGEGTAYVRIFEANRDRIRNPDLIYPGQVFTIPQ